MKTVLIVILVVVMMVPVGWWASGTSASPAQKVAGLTDKSSGSAHLSEARGANHPSIPPSVAYTLDLCTNKQHDAKVLPADCGGANPYGVAYGTLSAPHPAELRLVNSPLALTTSGRAPVPEALPTLERSSGIALSSWQTTYSLYLGNQTLLPGDVVVPSPSGASYGTYDPSTHLVYLTGAGGTIYELNSTTLNVVGELRAAVGGNLFYLASTNTLYVDSYGNVSLVDPTTDTLIRNVSVAQAGGGNDATFVYVPSWNTIIVGSEYASTVGVVSLTSNREIANVSVTGCFACVMDGTYDATTGLVYLANWGANEVQVLDPATWTITKNFPSPAGLFTSAVFSDPTDGDLLVSALFNCRGCGGSDYLIRENPSNGSSLGSLSLGAFTSGIAYDSGTGDVYVGDASTQKLYVVNPAGPTLLQTDPLPGEAWFIAAQIWPLDIPSLGSVLVPDSYSAVIDLLSASSGGLLASRLTSVNPRTIVPDPAFGGFAVAVGGMSVMDLVGETTLQVGRSVPLGVSPNDMAYDPVTQELWLTEGSLSGTGIQVLNAVNGRVVANITPSTFPTSVAVDTSTGNVFVGEGFGSPADVTVFDPRTHDPIANISVPQAPTQMVYAPEAHEIYILDSSSSNLTILSTTTDRVVGVTGVGNGPLSLAYGPATDDIYVGNYNSHNITVINATRGTSVASIYAQDPYGISQNATNGDLYVVNDTSTVEVIDAATHRNVSVSVGFQETGILGVPGGAIAEDPQAGALFWLANGTTSSPPPVVSGITAWPNPATAKLPMQFNVSASGGSVPVQYTYTGLPPGCTSTDAAFLPCTPTASGLFTVTVTVTDAQGRTSSAQVSLQVLPAPVVTSVAITPAGPFIQESATLDLNATATCSTGPCPSGIAFVWTTKGHSDGYVFSSTGREVVFRADSLTGTANLTVNASWMGTYANTTTVIYVVSGPVPTLLSVQISPAAGSVVLGGSQTFSAAPSCNGGTCPSGTTYAWKLSNSLGNLSSATGSSTVFKAGSKTGTVTLTVEATLNGKVAWSNTTITIHAKPSNSPGLFGLNGDLGYILVVVIVVAVAIVAVLVLMRKRKGARPSTPPPQPASSLPAVPPPT